MVATNHLETNVKMEEVGGGWWVVVGRWSVVGAARWVVGGGRAVMVLGGVCGPKSAHTPVASLAQACGSLLETCIALG